MKDRIEDTICAYCGGDGAEGGMHDLCSRRHDKEVHEWFSTMMERLDADISSAAQLPGDSEDLGPKKAG